MLKEHLDFIYTIEQLNINTTKTNIEKITNAAQSGNILKTREILDKTPNYQLEQLKSVAQKKFTSHMKESEKYVNNRMKKSSQRVKDISTITRASLLQIKSQSKDPQIQQTIGTTLIALEKIIDKLSDIDMTKKGISLILWAGLVGFFMGTLINIAPMLALSGVISIAAGIIVGLAKIVVGSFVEAKKEGSRTIS